MSYAGDLPKLHLLSGIMLLHFAGKDEVPSLTDSGTEKGAEEQSEKASSGRWDEHEIMELAQLFAKGKTWTEIAQRLNGRSARECKLKMQFLLRMQ